MDAPRQELFIRIFKSAVSLLVTRQMIFLCVCTGRPIQLCYLSMWHLMSWSISVDGLVYHNVNNAVSDSIKSKFGETRADKTGEFVQEKNGYANIFHQQLCYFLTLGCWISANAERLSVSEQYFIIPESKSETASQRYCAQLTELVGCHYKDAKHHLCVSHFNAHGICKESRTHASLAMAVSPSFFW